MKKILSLFAVIATLASCTKSSENPQSNSSNNISALVSKELVITKFTDNNSATNNAPAFSGYTFVFKADGTIAAVKNNVIETGSYTENPSHEGEAAKLTIAFGSTPLNELNKKWQVDLISNSEIHLSDDGNASEVLHFAAK